MKKIGIVGGVSWRSTVDYYSEICLHAEQRQLVPESHPSITMPEISIESLDHNKAVSYLGSDEDEVSWLQFDNYHRQALQRLERSGTDFALIASNTPHHRFDSIVRGIGIPVINIFDAVANVSARLGARQVLILGTSVTMKSTKLRAAFERHGIIAARPEQETAEQMTTELIADLGVGKIEGAQERVDNIVRTSIHHASATPPAVCLACTELPLAFEQAKTLSTFQYAGIWYINSSMVHVEAAVDFAFT